MKKAIVFLSPLLLMASTGMALAGHGKAGLWNVSTTMAMPAMQMPPEAMEKMKAMGMKMGSQTMTSQICMTAAQVAADAPVAMPQNQMGCTSNITSNTASAVTAEMVCNGRMKGRGLMRISWSGDSHYEGSYSFKGDVQGHAMESSSSFKGDWVKADCGTVKPSTTK
jgi:hypothetical protein